MARNKRRRILLNYLYLALQDLQKEINRRNKYAYFEPILVADLDSRKVIDTILSLIQDQDLGKFRNEKMIGCYRNVYIDNIMKVFKTQGYDDSLIPQAWNLVIINEIHKS